MKKILSIFVTLLFWILISAPVCISVSLMHHQMQGMQQQHDCVDHCISKVVSKYEGSTFLFHELGKILSLKILSNFSWEYIPWIFSGIFGVGYFFRATSPPFLKEYGFFMGIIKSTT